MSLKNNEKLKVISVAGPTCTGKSDLAVHLADAFNGEIINADSMQVYRYFNIGTAKPDEITRKRIPHHLIDIVDPSDEFNAAIFKEMADRAIKDIHSRGHIPIVVGGTGLYIRILLYGIFNAPQDPILRKSLQGQYRDDPLGMYKELKAIDYRYAMKIGYRDKIRVVRALEVYRLTGLNMSQWEERHGFRENHYNMMKIGLTLNRGELYEKINKRVDHMLASGWIDEVKDILAMGYNENHRPFSGIGYREILLLLKDLTTFEDMVKDIKRLTRHYAKRQFTWFSREKDMRWYISPKDMEKIKEEVSHFIEDGA
ncbi:MAG: tRNA (adenosine(37)-N6)-dimethylallyltransferase MiaA [Syntrophorhabdaceae bacterium]|nr:tRNA (adenosine(37)-N6)-dimethylallyltransferase MiaA [Syntrophorhabdales bacterium]MBP9560665.1 tRNA (adenosine(37)-N6)-dimethylallyltransferase MiaA [Syntrophorhabdaceae bacterium]